MYLENVTVTEELARITEALYPQHVSSDGANWLRSFKFTGSVKFDPQDKPQGSDGTPLVEISAPLCECRVIQPPLHMLNELVSIKATYWRHVARVKSPSGVHHEPGGEWFFEPWIDVQVARACGFEALGRAGVVPSINLISNVRGHVSITGRLPENEEELSMMAIAAELQPRSQSRDFDLYQTLKGK